MIKENKEVICVTKSEVKKLVMSMRTQENEAIINHLLGKIDMMEEKEIEQICTQLGNNESNIRKFLEEKISKKQTNQKDEKFPINDLFTYGISGNCIHLHLPVDLHRSLSENGVSKTIALINLYLLDAIDRIKQLKDEGFYRFVDKESIYMISPAMIKSEMKFLEGLDFTTHSYKKKQLEDEKFVQETPEAQLAIHILGKDKNIGTASIGFDTINSAEWQEKKQRTKKELEEKGASISDKSNITK